MLLDPAYVAGVFDSDGSFTVSRHTRKGAIHGFEYRVYLQLTWREVPETVRVLVDLKETYGGSIIHGIEKSGFSKHTSYVKYRINALKAVALIRDILPHLRVKRRQAEICYDVALDAKLNRYSRWHPRREADWRKLDEAYTEVGSLNWKNGKGRLAFLPEANMDIAK